MTTDEVQMNIREEAERLFAYDPSTGALLWRADAGRWKSHKAGTAAGWADKRGYLVVQVGRRKLYAHRVAWLLRYGAEPAGDIDHINGIKSDNRISNLRDVSRTVNKQNQRRAHSNSATGVLGVSPYKGKYRARIVVLGKERQIGTFETVDAAQAAYLAAKRELHEGCTL